MNLTLIYLQQPLLADRLFMRDFFAGYSSLKGNSLLVLGSTTGDYSQLSFLTKRISASLSESMVANMPLSGSQRNLITLKGNDFILKQHTLLKLYDMVQCVVLNTLVVGQEGTLLADPLTLLPQLRAQLEITSVILFPNNPQSPLGKEATELATEADYQRLVGAYEEEKTILELGLRLRPVWLAGTKNFFSV